MNESKGYWYLLTGLAVGIVLGILYAWAIAPLEYTNTSPDTLRANFKDEYRLLIALSHQSHGSLDRTRARLALLADFDPITALGEQAQRFLSANASKESIQALADLSEALQREQALPTSTLMIDATPVAVTITLAAGLPQQTAIPTTTDSLSPFEPLLEATPTPELSVAPSTSATLATGRTSTASRTPAKSATPIASATLKPSLTPTATPGAPFQLISQETFCEFTQPGLLQIDLQNAAGEPAAGIEISITWLGGAEQFFTGLKPELGYGYADFVMMADMEYVLSLSNGVTRITELQAPMCDSSEGAYPGSIWLQFRQP
jgi:hypothetical protein